MSGKTLLVIAASAELFLGAYFVLAFVAWTARTYLFTAGKAEFSPMLIVWASLAAASFWLYSKTLEKIHDLESTESKLREIEMTSGSGAAEESAEPANKDSDSHSLKS